MSTGGATYVPGCWLAVVGPAAAVLVADTVPAERLRPLWDAVRDGAPFGTIIDALTGGRMTGLPSFGFAVAEGDRVRLVVRPAMTVSVLSPNRPARTIDSRSASTWVEEVVERAYEIRLRTAAPNPDSGTLPLLGGIAYAAEVAWRPTGAPVDGTAGTPGTPGTAERERRERRDGSGTGQDATGGSAGTGGEPEVTEIGAAAARTQQRHATQPRTAARTPRQPRPDAAPHPPAPQPALAPAAAAPQPATRRSSAARPVAERPPAPLPPAPLPPAPQAMAPHTATPQAPTAPAPLRPEPVHAEPVHAEPVHAEPVHAEPVHAEPVRATPVHPEPVHPESRPEAARPQRRPQQQQPVTTIGRAVADLPPGADRRGVSAVFCADGHPSPPSSSRCRRCDALLPEQAPVPVVAPTLGALRFSTGESVPLDRTVIIGRSPSTHRSVGSQLPRLCRIAGASAAIARDHVEVRVEGWHVFVVDLGSPAGTTVTVPGEGPHRLSPLEPFRIEAGTRVGLEPNLWFDYEL